LKDHFAMKLALVTAALLAFSAPAQAQMMLTTPEEIAAVARGFGAASVQTSSTGSPILNGTIEGTNYGILMYGCDGTRNCESVQFFATFTGRGRDLEHLNTWNEDQRFGTAYINQEGRIFLHWSANLDYGITRQNLIDSFDIWRLTLAEFVTHLDG
tara:strand:- start:231 stop:698 length:468 start_codon:yes stop_codon:yes gene_type:complete